MRILLLPAIFAIALLVSSCASPRQTYVSQHPDLPAEHRRIILSGTIKYADPVVGMTKDEIRLTMGKPPTKTDTIDGEEAWIWIREKEGAQGDAWDATSVASVDQASQAEERRNSRASTMAAPGRRQVKTTVFFHGDLANRAQIDEESL